MQLKNNIMKKRPNISLKILGKNVCYLMHKLGVDAQILSEKTGVGIATINNLKKGAGNPTVATLSAVADFFNVSAGSLMDSDLASTSAENERVKSIPLINFGELDSFLGKKSVKKKFYTTEVDNPQDETLFAVEMTTNALLPEIEKGTICIISLSEKYCDGDVVLLNIRGSHLCFRRIFIGDTDYKFLNISIEINTQIIEYADYEIIGVLVKKINRLK